MHVRLFRLLLGPLYGMFLGSVIAFFHFIRGTDFGSGYFIDEVVALVALSFMYGSMYGIPAGISLGVLLAVQPTLGSIFVSLCYLTIPGLLLGVSFALKFPGNHFVSLATTSAGCLLGYVCDTVITHMRNQGQREASGRNSAAFPSNSGTDHDLR